MKKVIFLVMVMVSALVAGNLAVDSVKVSWLNSYIKADTFIDKYSLGGEVVLDLKAKGRTNFYVGYMQNTDSKKDVKMFKYGFNRTYGNYKPFVGFVIEGDKSVLSRGIGLDYGVSLKLFDKAVKGGTVEAGISVEFISDIAKLENTSIFQGLYIGYKF